LRWPSKIALCDCYNRSVMILLKPVFVQEPTGRPEGTEEATARRQEVYDPVNSTATYFIIIICKYVFLFHIY